MNATDTAVEDRTLVVDLADRRYPIHIGTGVIARAGELLAPLSMRRAVIVTNATVAAHHLAPLQRALASGGVRAEVIVVPDGESHKSWATLHDVLTRLLELRAERSTTLLALGGGVVGDLAGFAAAIYQRGIPYVQIPTTLLAQVDSSVGGKTAVNHPLGKNMIGAFYQPRAVLIDTGVLRTLPPREFLSGIPEIVKYGAIRDAGFFEWLEASIDALAAGDPAALAHAIHESCRIKAAIVGRDERESGERALLNLGHTFGHAIETAAGYGSWLHGEAVAAGMLLAARLSERVCGLSPSATERLAALLQRARQPLVPPRLPVDRWLDLMGRDKKVAGGTIRFVLLDAIGAARLVGGVPDDAVAAALAGSATPTR